MGELYPDEPLGIDVRGDEFPDPMLVRATAQTPEQRAAWDALVASAVEQWNQPAEWRDKLDARRK